MNVEKQNDFYFFSLKFYKKHTVLIHMYICLCINKVNSNNGNRDSKEEFTYLRVVYTFVSDMCAGTHVNGCMCTGRPEIKTEHCVSSSITFHFIFETGSFIELEVYEFV